MGKESDVLHGIAIKVVLTALNGSKEVKRSKWWA